MWREPSLTFEGALRILGKHEHRTIEKIDKLLGGVILGAGAAAGLVALGATPLAPVAAFGVVWGWVEQKGLAVELLRSAVDAVSGNMAGTRGYERRELIEAAHSVIAVASFFEALQEHVGKEFYGQLKITADEKKSLINQMTPGNRKAVVDVLYSSEIPAPSALFGFEENVERVAKWQTEYALRLRYLTSGLMPANQEINWSAVLKTASERYRTQYLKLAVKVPEFAMWAQLVEHAATRSAVRQTGAMVTDSIEDFGNTLRELNADVMFALQADRDALNRVEVLLSAYTHGTILQNGEITSDSQRGELSELQATVRRANSGILDEKIIPAGRDRYPAGLEIPRVSEIYINPRYRVAEFDTKSRPADEQWWDRHELHDDFDIFLARYVTSADASRQPLLLLGHPGAGKSLLTKVFATRLPPSDYTVVRVPLRRVSADAEIHHQIGEALEISTHQQIAWSDLARESRETVRVVLLDGLDELLQASEHDRSSYLVDIMRNFQSVEAAQLRPVVVIVTSRTVVADRVYIPDGTTIVKLDPL